MPYTLDGILAHVRAQGRPGSHQAVLVREIERLRAEADRHDTPPWQAAEINRIEVIDQTGRIFVAHETLSDVRLSFQDEGRTLKVFCHRRAYDPSELPDHLKAAIQGAKMADEHRGLDGLMDEPEPGLFTHQPAGLTAYTFRIAWSAEDGEWVGTCDQLPSLSYLHHDPVEAAEWICSLAADYLDEAKETTDV
jgi:hypothetical protein